MVLGVEWTDTWWSGGGWNAPEVVVLSRLNLEQLLLESLVSHLKRGC